MTAFPLDVAVSAHTQAPNAPTTMEREALPHRRTIQQYTRLSQFYVGNLDLYSITKCI